MASSHFYFYPMSSNETSILIELRGSCRESMAIRHRSQWHPMTRGDDISILSNFQLQRLPRAHCNHHCHFSIGIRSWTTWRSAPKICPLSMRPRRRRSGQKLVALGEDWKTTMGFSETERTHTFFGKYFVNATRCCSFWNPPRWLRWCWSGYRLVTLEKSLIFGVQNYWFFWGPKLLGIWSAWQRVFRLAEICWADWIHVDLAPNPKKSAHKMNRACWK